MSQTSDHAARSAGDAVAHRTSNWVTCALLRVWFSDQDMVQSALHVMAKNSLLKDICPKLHLHKIEFSEKMMRVGNMFAKF